jgi:hypothetical protein
LAIDEVRMNVEGLWFLQLASLRKPAEFQHGGIVVLESARVLGADSICSYLGEYQVEDEELIGQIRVQTWNKDVHSENIFGTTAPIDYQVHVRGKRQGNVIDGSLTPIDTPDLKLPIRLHFIADLP